MIPEELSENRDWVLLDHLINLTDQVRRLADGLRRAGLPVPDDVGTLGPAREEVVARYTEESYRRHSICPNCGGAKVPGTLCKGDVECNEAPDGTAAECCEDWGSYCCRCGYSYALGQLP